MSWNNQPNQGQQGWSNQGQQGQQGWSNQPQQQGFSNQGQQGWSNQGQQQGFQPQQQQGFQQQGFQQQGWGNQPQQQQGWNNQQTNQHGHHGHQFVPAQHQLYKLVSGINHKFVLDVSQSSNQNEFNKLIIFKDHNAPNQKFLIQSVGNGRYAFFNAKNNLTVEVPSQDNGCRVHCSQPNKQQNEFWELVPANGVKGFENKNAFYIKSYNGKCLDVSEGKAKDEAHVIQWDYNGGSNQVWVIEPTK